MPCFSQGYLVHHYTETDGLPSANVHDITQDPSGRLWFATRGGITVYDGYSWERYTLADGLPALPFYKIRADRQGNIWALSREADRFIVVAHEIRGQLMGQKEKPLWETIAGNRRDSGTQTGISSWMEMSSFQVVEPDTPGKNASPLIVVGTTTQGVFLLHEGSWRNINETDGLLSNTVNGIAYLEGKLYAATAGGLSALHIDVDMSVHVDNRLNELLELPSRGIMAVGIQYKDRFPDTGLTHSRVWLYGNDWLGYFEEHSPKMIIYPAKVLASDGEQVAKLVPDYRRGLYINNQVELLYFDFHDESWHTLRTDSGLFCGGGNALFVDFEKNTWLACERGINKISSRRFGNLQRIHRLLDDEVTAVLEYQPGHFILGHNNGFTFYDGKDFTPIPLYQVAESRRLSIRVLDIQQDSKGNIWAAMSWGGLAKISSLPPHTITWYGKNHGVPNQLNTLWITRDKNHREHIWLGSAEGVFVSENGTGYPRFVEDNLGISPPPSVRRIFGDQERIRYLATGSSGLYMYRDEEKTWVNYRLPNDNDNDRNRDRSKANNIYAVKKLSGGELVVGTMAGVYVLEDNKLKEFRMGETTVNRPVFFIVEDLKHRLWFGTDNGVLRWDGYELKKYTPAQGLVGHETNRAAGIVDSFGKVWIGTDTGVSIYNEDFDDNDLYKPQPRVRLLSLETADHTLIPFPENSPLELASKENSITLHFQGVSFYDEKANRFRYYLEGFEESWSDEQTYREPVIRYPNLPPGRYRFHLKMANARGIWSDEVISPFIIISRPFFRQWWFYILGVVLAGGVFFVISRFFHEKRHAVLLERQVQERTRLLEAIEQRYRRLFEDTMDVVFITTPEGKLIDINTAGVESLGFQTREEMLALESIAHLYADPADRDAMRKEIEEKGFIKDYEITYRRKDGELIVALLTATLERDAAGQIVAFRGIARDITERKRLEQQLIQSRKMEAIGTLAGGIAHDFNNILAVIMGQGELICDELLEGTRNPDEATVEWIRKCARHVVNAADRGAELVRQILTFSRQSKRERKPLDLTVIIKDSLSLLRSILPATIEIRQKIDSTGRTVLADSTQIRQVMLNFGTNAAHAMRENGGLLEVSLDEVYLDEETITQYDEIKPGVYLRLAVSDTGHGMLPEVQKRIFDPYFTTKKVGEGTGMGLAVIHGIVKSHDGEITVQSEPGKGTTFQVFLPCMADNKKAVTAADTGEIPGGSERILLVDDEERLVDAIGQLLEKIGYSVKGVTDPLEALELFRREPDQYDLVISDVTMPRMTGIQLSKELKLIVPDIPVILFSGFKSSLSGAQLRALGIGDYVMKPINRLNLARAIRRVLDKKS